MQGRMPRHPPQMARRHTSRSQGDILAPFPFFLILDHALRQVIDGREEELKFTLNPTSSRRVQSVTIIELDFADDMESNLRYSREATVSSAQSECRKYALHLNTRKTKVMAINKEGKAVTNRDGSVIEVVDELRYFDAYITLNELDPKTQRVPTWNALEVLGLTKVIHSASS